jgi:DNA-binding XRE family transcriptional regulator
MPTQSTLNLWYAMGMKNPYVRLRELCGTSQKAFAAKYGFGKMTMVYLESGMYTRVSDRQNVALGKECNEKGVDARQVLAEEYSASTLNEAFWKWRSQERREKAPVVLAKASHLFDYAMAISPVIQLVSDTTGSLQGFCKLLKVPSITVSRYAKGETATMPSELREALQEAGYPFITDLEVAQEKWREK